jgi:hypothetical protein
MTYAKNTTVSVEKSRAEIEQIVLKHGAVAFSYAINTQKAMIQFEAHQRVIRFILPLPDRKTFNTKKDRWGYTVAQTEGKAAHDWEQACRTRWRALKIAILAKLEAVDAGIAQFEEEFLAQIVDPATGRTVYEVIGPQLAVNYEQCASRPIGLPAPDDAIDVEAQKL